MMTYTKTNRSLSLFLSLLLLLFAFRSKAGGEQNLPQLSQPGVYQGYTYAQYKGYTYTSRYIVTRDSILLAADIFLPRHLEKGKKIPVILYLTRYQRTLQAKCPFNLLQDPVFGDISENEIKFFTSYGYACVVVDVRGTGASTGARKMEFGREEVADGKDIVNWLIAQAWCNGNVGCSGVSYVGTTCELLLANQHPNVKACIPRSAIWDLYTDIVFPGGICAGPFVSVWGATTYALDQSNFAPFGKKAKMLVKGVHPVSTDKHLAIWKKALLEHKNNFNVSQGIDEIKYRDDIQNTVKASLNDFSVHNNKTAIEGSGTPIYRIDGWYDGALGKGALDAALNTQNTKKVLIGPWDHGPRDNVSPFAASKKVGFSVKTEMLRFFDFYLKGIKNGIDKEARYTYFTVGEEKWKTSETWPPGETKTSTFYLSADSSLLAVQQQISDGNLQYKIDYNATTGPSARWNSLTDLYMHGPTDYPNRKAEDEKLLCFTSGRLEKEMCLNGTAIIHLNFAADAADATVFCYLEDVSDSAVTYISEGMLRPVDRKVSHDAVYKTLYPEHSFRKEDALPIKPGETMELVFDMLPISYLIKAGHHLRISIAGADQGHFNLPNPKPNNFIIGTSSNNPSYIELPVSEK